jgi:predicted metalloenzyme YecM
MNRFALPTGNSAWLELPWPGEKRYPHEGWEHIEIVLPGEPETLNARALALLSDEGLSKPGIFVKPAHQKESVSVCQTRRLP